MLDVLTVWNIKQDATDAWEMYWMPLNHGKMDRKLS